MKKIIVFLFIPAFAFNSAYPQQKSSTPRNNQPVTNNKEPDQPWLGIFAGPNLNYLDYYDKSTTIEGTNTSFHAGIFYQKSINKYFALQPALLFSIRGGRIRNIDSTINASLMYIEFPVNILYRHKQLMLGGGPDFCYGINGKLKTNGKGRNAYDKNESFERTLKRFEFGGNFMIGYTFKKRIFISTNFSPGFTNIYKGDGSAPGNVRAKTRVFGISLGYFPGIPKSQ